MLPVTKKSSRGKSAGRYLSLSMLDFPWCKGHGSVAGHGTGHFNMHANKEQYAQSCAQLFKSLITMKSALDIKCQYQQVLLQKKPYIIKYNVTLLYDVSAETSYFTYNIINFIVFIHTHLEFEPATYLEARVKVCSYYGTKCSSFFFEKTKRKFKAAAIHTVCTHLHC